MAIRAIYDILCWLFFKFSLDQEVKLFDKIAHHIAESIQQVSAVADEERQSDDDHDDDNRDDERLDGHRAKDDKEVDEVQQVPSFHALRRDVTPQELHPDEPDRVGDQEDDCGDTSDSANDSCEGDQVAGTVRNLVRHEQHENCVEKRFGAENEPSEVAGGLLTIPGALF